MWYCGGICLWTCSFVIRGRTWIRVELKVCSFIQGPQSKVKISLMYVGEEHRNVCSFWKLVVFFTLYKKIFGRPRINEFSVFGKQFFASIFSRVMKQALEDDFPLLVSNIMLMLLLPIILGWRPDQWHAGSVGRKITFWWITRRCIRTYSETDAGLYKTYWRTGWNV